MKYENIEKTEMSPEGTSMWDAMGKMITGVPGRTPDSTIENVPIDLSLLGKEDCLIWLGHSSVFLQLDGIRILIDPVFSKRASPVAFSGPKAFPYKHNYSTSLFDGVDLILQTHDHYDHLDKNSILSLSRTAKHILVPSGVKEMMAIWGIDEKKIIEQGWGDKFEYESLQIDTLTARHFSGRGLTYRNTTLWCSYAIRSKNRNIFHSGDSGYGKHFAEIGEKQGSFDLAFVECGQYNENWPQIHMMPEESVQAAIDLKSRKMIPIHHSKFALSIHPWKEPVQRAQKAAQDEDINLLTPKIGEVVRLVD